MTNLRRSIIRQCFEGENRNSCEHIGHGNIVNLIFRGGTNFTYDIDNHIRAGKEMSQGFKNYTLSFTQQINLWCLSSF